MLYVNNEGKLFFFIKISVDQILQQQFLGKLPDDDAGCDGDVHRVLGAKLGDLQTTVTLIDHLLMNALYLVAEDYGIALFVVGGKFHR